LDYVWVGVYLLFFFNEKSIEVIHSEIFDGILFGTCLFEFESILFQKFQEGKIFLFVLQILIASSCYSFFLKSLLFLFRKLLDGLLVGVIAVISMLMLLVFLWLGFVAIAIVTATHI
jgi:hypothetical protein